MSERSCGSFAENVVNISDGDARASLERRSNRRISLRLDVAVPVIVRSAIGTQRGWVRNISEGGVLLELVELPGLGASIDITFAGVHGSLDAAESVTLQGEVRHQLALQHVRSGRARVLRAVGVRFLNAAEVEAAALKSRLTGCTLH